MPEWIDPEVWDDLRKTGFAIGSDDFKDFYAKYAIKQKDARVLVVGTSTGEILKVLRKVGCKGKLTAFDISEQSIRATKKKIGKAEIKAELLKATALDMPFKKDTFDQVIMTDFLLDNLGGESPVGRAMGEAFRVLKPGGRFLTVASNFTYDIVPVIVGLLVNSVGLAALPPLWNSAQAMFSSAMDANARGDHLTAITVTTTATGMICVPVFALSYLSRRVSGVSVKGNILDYKHPTLSSSVLFILCLILSMKNFDGSKKEHWKRAASFSKYQRLHEKNYTMYQKKFLKEILRFAGGKDLSFEKLSTKLMLGHFSSLGITAVKRVNQ